MPVEHVFCCSVFTEHGRKERSHFIAPLISYQPHFYNILPSPSLSLSLFLSWTIQALFWNKTFLVAETVGLTLTSVLKDPLWAKLQTERLLVHTYQHHGTFRQGCITSTCTHGDGLHTVFLILVAVRTCSFRAFETGLGLNLNSSSYYRLPSKRCRLMLNVMCSLGYPLPYIWVCGEASSFYGAPFCFPACITTNQEDPPPRAYT